MVNFATPAPTYSAKRVYKPISDLGEWLIKKAQAHKKKYIDDEESFE